MSGKPKPNILPAAYTYLLPWVQEIALRHGYAIALHGSMARDMDVIAVPWVPDAAPAEELVAAIAAEVRPWGEQSTVSEPTQKPHGRRAWAVQFSCGPYLDISVMPRQEA